MKLTNNIHAREIARRLSKSKAAVSEFLAMAKDDGVLAALAHRGSKIHYHETMILVLELDMTLAAAKERLSNMLLKGMYLQTYVVGTSREQAIAAAQDLLALFEELESLSA